jgi:hypothetical protein
VVVRGDLEERRQRPGHGDEGAEMGAQRGLLLFCGRGTGRMVMKKLDDEYLGRRSWSWGAAARHGSSRTAAEGYGAWTPAASIVGQIWQAETGGQAGRGGELSTGICLVHGGRTRGGEIGWRSRRGRGEGSGHGARMVPEGLREFMRARQRRDDQRGGSAEPCDPPEKIMPRRGHGETEVEPRPRL